jgi:hypothetical protein
MGWLTFISWSFQLGHICRSELEVESKREENEVANKKGRKASNQQFEKKGFDEKKGDNNGNELLWDVLIATSFSFNRKRQVAGDKQRLPILGKALRSPEERIAHCVGGC